MRTSIIALIVLTGCTSFSQKSADSSVALPPVTGKSQPAVQTIPDAKIQPVVPDTKLISDDAGTDLRRSVYYEFDRYEVKAEYRGLVEQHAAWLRANPRARLMIVGNTDERGTSEYNLALGQRRAESVTRMLLLLGVKDEQIEAVSFGKEKPRAAGHDEASWAENRRSDFSRP